MRRRRTVDREEHRLRVRNTVISLIVILFFVGIILLFYSMLYAEKRRSIIQSGRMTATQTADRFDDYLTAVVDEVRITSFTLEDMVDRGKGKEELLDYLVGQTSAITQTVFENTTGLYAYINGVYLDGAYWEPGDDYVVEERPWYIKALSGGGEIVLVEPYLDMQTGDVIMTIAKLLKDKKSVVAVDITLDYIQTVTEQTVKSGESDIEFILDETGHVVAHSDRSEIGKDYFAEQGTLAAELMADLNASERDFLELDHDGNRYIAYSAKIRNNWRCVSVKNATRIFRPLTTIMLFAVVLSAAVVAVLLQIFRSSNERSLIAERLNKQLSSSVEIYRSAQDLDILNDTYAELLADDRGRGDPLGSYQENAQLAVLANLDKIVDLSCKTEVMDFVDFSTMDERMRGRRTITLEFLTSDKTWLRGRLIVSRYSPEGDISHVLWMMEDIDEEKRNRDRMTEAIKTLNNQLSSVANIYYSLHDIDLVNNRLDEIKTEEPGPDELPVESSENAQEVLFDVMRQLTDKGWMEDSLKFIDLSTIQSRMKDRDSISWEFMSILKIWFRERFVVSRRDENGEASHVLWMVENIDEEKRGRERLKETAQILNTQISSIAGIYMTMYEMNIVDDTFNEIKASNELIVQLIGRGHEHAQAILQKVMEHMTDSSALDEMRKFIVFDTLDERLGGRNTIALEYPSSQNEWRRARFIVSKRDEDGRLTHVLWLVENIDKEKKDRERLLDMSQRAIAASEAKSAFLSNMSHEIRTPINAVLGMNEMILRECEDEEILFYSENIRTAGNTLLGIINDILDFSRIEAGKVEIIPVDYDLCSTLNDLVNMTQTRAEDKGLRFITRFDRNTPRLLNGDEVRIKQIIMNILTNAVKYTDQGEIVFSLSSEWPEGEEDSVNLHVSVKDTGVGIRAEDMERLFTEFDRIDEGKNRQVEGTGLGMNITRSLLDMMGSTLEVQSTYGVGSEFSFTLRQKVVNRKPLGDYEESYRELIGDHQKYHEKFIAPEAYILAVDDNAMNLTVFGKLLKHTLIKIDTATGGDEALVLSRSRKYDIIFLDHMMPEKDGIETLHELRAQEDDMNRETPVICLTANAISGARQLYLEEGFDNYLTKPVDYARLEDMLLEYLPEEKVWEVKKEEGEKEEALRIPDELANLGELDISAGIKFNGDARIYLETLRVFTDSVDQVADEIKAYHASGDLKNETIKIHALKSTARIIGALEIGERALELEEAGKAEKKDVIDEKLDGLLDDCKMLAEKIRPILLAEEEKADEQLPLIGEEKLRELYGQILHYARECDDASIEDVMSELRRYRLSEGEKKRREAIQRAVNSFDFDMIVKLLT